jgi:hypothetical protein
MDDVHPVVTGAGRWCAFGIFMRDETHLAFDDPVAVGTLERD